MVLPIVCASLGLVVIVAFFISGRETVKLKCRNRLLCRENHKLRIKLKEYEDGTKGK